MAHTRTPHRLLQLLHIRRSDALDLLVTAACVLFLLALHLVSGYLALIALLWAPEGPWDHSADDDVRALCTAIVVIEVVAAAATAATVKAAILRSWWYSLPAGIALIAAVRFAFPPAGRPSTARPFSGSRGRKEAGLAFQSFAKRSS